MITIFSTPKAFNGHIGLIQRNALNNWSLFDQEIILFCDDPGVGKAAKKYGARHIPKVERTKFGTPIIGSIFHRAQLKASNDLMMYVNTDIVFTRGILETAEYVNSNLDQFLVIGNRYDLNVGHSIKYKGEWPTRWEKRAKKSGVPHSGGGVDYFMFRKGMYKDMPKFALGRGFWDSWLMGRAFKDGVPVIDASDIIFAIHQNHDYMHLPPSAPHRNKRDRWHSKGPETNRNNVLRGDCKKLRKDATHKLIVDSSDNLFHKNKKHRFM